MPDSTASAGPRRLESQVLRFQDYVKRLHSVLDVGLLINTLDLGTVQKRVIELTTDIVRAERGALMLLDEETGTELTFEVLVDAETESEAVRKVHLRLGQGIAGYVAETGQVALVNDAANDPRFFGGVDKVSGFHTRSILAVPLKLDDDVIGVIEYCNKLPDNTAFDEQDVKLVSAIANMVAVAVSNARSYRRAITDRLTGLYNFGYFRDSLSRLMRRGEPVGLLIFDVDHFKHYNDTHGHDAGNDGLMVVARLLRDECGPRDVVARYGGEEFVVLMPGATVQEAGERAERLRARVWSTDFRGGDRQPLGRVSVSVGVAAAPQCAGTDEALIHAADQALYAAKAGGRNRVVAAGASAQ
jgi:diguanylate cyclase (GGDEF)-like protein